MQWYGSSRCIVWGSGIINQEDNIQNSTFLAVRGKYTQARIKELGYTAPEVIGDPALIMPLIYNPDVKKKYKLGIIPHITHYEIIRSKIASSEIKIIKLDDHDLEKVIDEIVSCSILFPLPFMGLLFHMHIM